MCQVLDTIILYGLCHQGRCQQRHRSTAVEESTFGPFLWSQERFLGAGCYVVCVTTVSWRLALRCCLSATSLLHDHSTIAWNDVSQHRRNTTHGRMVHKIASDSPTQLHEPVVVDARCQRLATEPTAAQQPATHGRHCPQDAYETPRQPPHGRSQGRARACSSTACQGLPPLKKRGVVINVSTTTPSVSRTNQQRPHEHEHMAPHEQHPRRWPHRRHRHHHAVR